MHRLVNVPEVREPPPECLRALRGLSPRAEMVYAANGLWWLGVVRDDIPAISEGWKLVAQNRAREARGKEVRLGSLRKALLMTQGFQMLASLDSRHGGCDPTPGQCVNALAPALFSTHKEDEAMQDERERESDGTNRRDRSTAMLLGDVMLAHMRDVRRTFRRKSFTSRGATPNPPKRTAPKGPATSQ